MKGVAGSAGARAQAAAARALTAVSSKLSIGAVLACCAVLLLPQVAADLKVASAPPSSPPPGTPALPPPTPVLPSADSGHVAVVRSRPLPARETPGAGTEADAPLEREVLLAKRQAAPPAPPPASKTPPKVEPQPPAAQPPPASQPAAPTPGWSEAEIAAALKACVQLLGPVAADVEVMPAMRQERCGTAAPVLLKRIGSGLNPVEVQPPAVLNCAMVAKLATWVDGTLQPVAKDALASSVKRLNSASGYVCRGRNGDTYGNGKLSEHALANAIDIASFTLADGRIIDVGKHWGPTQRDRPQPAAPTAARPPQPTPPARNLLPKRGAAQAAPAPATPAAAKGMPAEPEAQFLRRLHQGACGVFGTVLGPEANEAHREHFHFDLHPRKQSAFCQ